MYKAIISVLISASMLITNGLINSNKCLDIKTDDFNTQDIIRDVDSQDNFFSIQHNLELYNFTDKDIDKVYLVRGEETLLLASDIKVSDKILVEWDYIEDTPLSEIGFSEWWSPHFILIIDGEEVYIETSKICINEHNDIYEQLYLTSAWIGDSINYENEDIFTNEIAFYYEDDAYYFSPQLNYIELVNGNMENMINIKYIYLHKMLSWVRQQDEQLLFGIGLRTDELKKLFPEYNIELDEYLQVVFVSIETIYLEDMILQEDEYDFRKYKEIQQTEEIKEFTVDDLLVLPINNHIRTPERYFRYLDVNGDIHRQYIMDQSRDNNNGSIVNKIMRLEDDFYTLEAFSLEN